MDDVTRASQQAPISVATRLPLLAGLFRFNLTSHSTFDNASSNTISDQSGLESFPTMSQSSHQFIRSEPSKPHSGTTRLRSKSSGLQGEPRGDATGPALATVFDATPNGSPTVTPPSVSRAEVLPLFRTWLTQCRNERQIDCGARKGGNSSHSSSVGSRFRSDTPGLILCSSA